MWPFKKPEVSLQPQPLLLSEASTTRCVARLSRLYDWMEQKGGKNPEKDAEVQASIDRYRYQLAGKGLPLVTCKEDLEGIS